MTCYIFRYGQLSGMVEPVAGICGSVAVIVSINVQWNSSIPISPEMRTPTLRTLGYVP